MLVYALLSFPGCTRFFNPTQPAISRPRPPIYIDATQRTFAFSSVFVLLSPKSGNGRSLRT